MELGREADQRHERSDTLQWGIEEKLLLLTAAALDAARGIGADLVIAVFLEAANNRTPSSIVDVIGLSFAILQRHADLEWRARADIIIEPVVKDFLWDDFEKTTELMAAGEAAARAALPNIRAAIAAKSSSESSEVNSGGI